MTFSKPEIEALCCTVYSTRSLRRLRWERGGGDRSGGRWKTLLRTDFLAFILKKNLKRPKKIAF